MKESELKLLAESWIRMHHAEKDSHGYNENFWAYNKLCDLCDDEPIICFEVINKIRSLDGSDVILSNLAAGPLEDLLSQHGELIINKIEKLTEHDNQLKKMLGAVWKDSISDSIWKRIQAVASPSW
ncbi:MAG: DUF6869 domain-containing protein [Thermodesulfobacteriota bacterium]